MSNNDILRLKALKWRQDHPLHAPDHIASIIEEIDALVLFYIVQRDADKWHAALKINFGRGALWSIDGFLNLDEAKAACEMHYMANFGVEHK